MHLKSLQLHQVQTKQEKADQVKICFGILSQEFQSDLLPMKMLIYN